MTPVLMVEGVLPLFGLEDNSPKNG
jgi:hypothetical protein